MKRRDLARHLSAGAVAGLVLALLGVRMVSSPTEPKAMRQARERIGRLVPGH